VLLKSESVLPEEIEVPGGVVSIDPYKDRSAILVWSKAVLSSLWRSYFAAEEMQRDIVIRDENRQRVLYREGPYNAITVAGALDRLLSEVRSSGLDAFLRTRQVAASQVGPLDVPSRVGLWGQLSPYLRRTKKDHK
jgi:hypothetical protein